MKVYTPSPTPVPVFRWALLALALALLAPLSALGDDTRYYFNYYYNGSSDYYTGYVYAPTGYLTTGERIYNDPWAMGGWPLKGYYYITDATSGFSSSSDREEYITSFYDGNTGKISTTLYASPGQTTAGASLYVADRATTYESGYVYDPSVPASDPFFGNPAVTYYFSDSSDSSVDFLEAYIPDLPYWTQPSSYPGSCSEVAGAIVLAYWDNSAGYTNLISTTDWQTLWPDSASYNQDSPDSYVEFIGTLAKDMGYSGGTYDTSIGPGLLTYATAQGYGNTFSFTLTPGPAFGGVDSWSFFTNDLNANDPVIVNIEYTDQYGAVEGHSIVARGYWNNGAYLADFGWGLSYENVKEYWYTPVNWGSYDAAQVDDFVSFFPQ